jgi:hypothetical protein
MKDQRVSICLEYARVNNARELVIPMLLFVVRCINIWQAAFLAKYQHFQKCLFKFKRSYFSQYCMKIHMAYIKI